jgi:hypothetical protein
MWRWWGLSLTGSEYGLMVGSFEPFHEKRELS